MVCVSDVLFLATTWDQGMLFGWMGVPVAGGSCKIMLTDGLDSLLERTMNFAK